MSDELISLLPPSAAIQSRLTAADSALDLSIALLSAQFYRRQLESELQPVTCQVGVKEGVVLLTYSSLISAADSGASRLQQLVDWCKPGFDGLIVFDGRAHSWPSFSFLTHFAPSYVLHRHQAASGKPCSSCHVLHGKC